MVLGAWVSRKGNRRLVSLSHQPNQDYLVYVAGLMKAGKAKMVVPSLVLPHSVNRWANIIVAAGWFLFNLAGLKSYSGHYDRFLLAVSMVFNVVTVWTAWKWV
jgi:hypothetical protein